MLWKVSLWAPVSHLFVFLLQVACLRESCAHGIRSAQMVSTTHTHTHTLYVTGSMLTQRLYMKIFTSQGFILTQPCVYLSVTCPSSLSYLSPSPSPISIATVTSRWARHPHSCANTAMSHWHTLTHFSVEIALTHTRSHWTEYKMDRHTCNSGADMGLYLCSVMLSLGLRREHGRKLLVVMTSQRLLVWLVEKIPLSLCLSLWLCLLRNL